LKQNARDSIIEEVSRLEKELKVVSTELRRVKSQEAIKGARQISQSFGSKSGRVSWLKTRKHCLKTIRL
jgi:hypothetical protein